MLLKQRNGCRGPIGTALSGRHRYLPESFCACRDDGLDTPFVNQNFVSTTCQAPSCQALRARHRVSRKVTRIGNESQVTDGEKVGDCGAGRAPGSTGRTDYVRRTEYRAERSGGIAADGWSGPKREESKMSAGMRAWSAAAGRRALECRRRTGEAVNLVRTTVKSLVGLSVRDCSSGNSPPTMPHNSRKAMAVTRILPR